MVADSVYTNANISTWMQSCSNKMLMFLQIYRHSSFLTYLLVGVTTWCDDDRARELLNGVGVTPHAEGNDGSMRWQREAQIQNRNWSTLWFVFLFCEEKRICERVCQQSPDFGGKPKEVPHFFCFQTGGQTSGLQMNIRSQREREGKCVHPLKAFRCCSSRPYITHAAFFTTLPIHLWLPIPPHHRSNPSPSSSYPSEACNTPTCLQTNKSLGSPVILCFVFVVWLYDNERCHCLLSMFRNSLHSTN